VWLEEFWAINLRGAPCSGYATRPDFTPAFLLAPEQDRRTEKHFARQSAGKKQADFEKLILDSLS